MDIPHGSDGTFPREGPWLGKVGLAAAGLMIGVVLGMSISPWTAPEPAAEPALHAASQGTAPVAPVDAAQTASVLSVTPTSLAPAEVQGMELCWGGDEPVRC